MIVKWNKDNVKYLGDKFGHITLLPGHNEVKDTDWARLRKHVLDQIESKLIEEIEVKVEIVDKKGPGGKVIGQETEIEAKPFNALNPSKSESIVKETFNLETLKTWKENENRDSLRAALGNQIDKVEKYGPTAKTKTNK